MATPAYAPPHPTLPPPPSPGRVRSLDVLRGIAILGTLGTNIFGWVLYDSGAMPFALENMLAQLPNGKFLALLTFMFGIGLTIQRDSAARANRQWPQVYLWRGVLLFLDGLIHYLLVFAFDVLMAYALVGLLVSYLLLTSDRVQRWVFALAASLHLAFIFLPVMGIALPFLGSFGIAENIDGDFRPLSDQEIAEIERLQPEIDLSAFPETTWWSEVVYRAETFMMGREEAIFILPMATALFILGSWAYRAGLFEARGRRMRLAMIAIGVSAFGFDMLGAVDFEWTMPGSGSRYLLPIFVAMGIAGGVAEFYQRRGVGWIGRRLEDVGRLALSCYVGQNVVSMFLYSPWALEIQRFIPEEWGIWRTGICYLIVAAFMLIFSYLWRRRFDRGPLEWLWNVSYRWLMQLTPHWGRQRTVAPAAVTS